MAWPRGQPRPAGAGRQKGSRNKRTREAQAVARRIVEDPTVQSLWLTQAQSGELSAAIVQTLMYYAWGKPVERHEVTGEEGAPMVLQVVYENGTEDEETG